MIQTVIDKIHYKLLLKDKTAHILGFSVASFPEIPKTVTFGENTFKVVAIDHLYGLNLSQEVIKIPDFINELYPNSFSKYSIKRLILGKGLTKLPSGCFSYCNIGEIIFSKDSRITDIGSDCFRRCVGFKHVDIPNSVTKIHHSAFYYCTDLEFIKLPELSYLGHRTFKGCKNLTQIYFKNVFSAEKYKKKAFLNNVFPIKNGKINIEFLVPDSNLEEIANSKLLENKQIKIRSYYQSTGEYFTDLAFEILDGDKCAVTYKLDENGNNVYTGDIIIPNKVVIGSKVYSVVGISEFAFHCCKDLSTIEIPDTMEESRISPLALDEDCLIFKRSKNVDEII